MAQPLSVNWDLRRVGPDSWQGTVTLPYSPAKVVGGGASGFTAKGADKASALGKAATLAKQAISNPLVAAVLPPGATVAVHAIDTISKGAAAGKLAEAAKQFVGPGLDRLVDALGDLF